VELLLQLPLGDTEEAATASVATEAGGKSALIVSHARREKARSLSALGRSTALLSSSVWCACVLRRSLINASVSVQITWRTLCCDTTPSSASSTKTVPAQTFVSDAPLSQHVVGVVDGTQCLFSCVCWRASRDGTSLRSSTEWSSTGVCLPPLHRAVTSTASKVIAVRACACACVRPRANTRLLSAQAWA
jgi:hypothetical protein